VPDATELDDLSRQLHAVEAAMARLDAGTYGTCQDCAEPIAETTLLADATASRCGTCADTRLDG